MTTTLDRRDQADVTLAPVLGRLDGGNVNGDPFVDRIVGLVRTALKAEPNGTMAAWMARHHGQRVTTIQVHNGTGTTWCPTGRTIDAMNRAGGVFFSDSFREYRGMRVITATPDVLIVADDWHTIAYITEG